MTLPAWLASATDAWGSYYGDHKVVSVAIRFLHLAGLVVGGGMAVATDRSLWHAKRDRDAERAATLKALARSHRTVVPAFIVVIVTGVVMTAADAQTFLASRLFWIKMGLVGLLALNGLGLLRAERAATHGEEASGWTWLSITSGISLLLWMVLLLVGTWLPVAA